MAKQTTSQPAWSGTVLDVRVMGPMIYLDLHGGPAPADPREAIVTEVDKVRDEVRQSPAGQALLRQRERLEDCRKQLAEAQQAAATAQQERTKALADGDDFADADRRLDDAMAAAER